MPRAPSPPHGAHAEIWALLDSGRLDEGATRIKALANLAAAEDALTAALGHPVRVRARGDGCRVELDFDSPADAVVLAEQILSAGARDAV